MISVDVSQILSRLHLSLCVCCILVFVRIQESPQSSLFRRKTWFSSDYYRVRGEREGEKGRAGESNCTYGVITLPAINLDLKPKHHMGSLQHCQQ